LLLIKDRRLGMRQTGSKVWVIYSGSKAMIKGESQSDIKKLCKELNDKLESKYVVKVSRSG
jgi:hypothetical protein